MDKINFLLHPTPARWGRRRKCQPSQKSSRRPNAWALTSLSSCEPRLDRVEARLWHRELGRVTAKHRQEHLTDAKIDELVLKRRSRGRQP